MESSTTPPPEISQIQEAPPKRQKQIDKSCWQHWRQRNANEEPNLHDERNETMYPTTKSTEELTQAEREDAWQTQTRLRDGEEGWGG